MSAIVTIVRDRTSHLRELVRGLERSTRAPSQLVVVVMGGEDPEPALRELTFPVRVEWCPPDNGLLPLARARNLGIASVQDDDHVVVLDVDCIPGIDLVARYSDALESLDALCMGPVRYLDPGANEPGWNEADLHRRSRPHPVRQAPRGLVPIRTDAYGLFWSLSFAVHRATFEDRIGGFDESLDGYGGEDTDLAFSARSAGVPLAWVPGAVAYHQHHDTYAPPLQHVRSIVDNARRFRAKWGEWPMEGWLRAFSERGLVAWDPVGDGIELVREPSADEIAAARRDHVVAR